MKLYFYQYDNNCEMSVKECEVVERKQSYKVVNGHMPFTYLQAFNKDSLGYVTKNFTFDLIVLDHKDDDYAKQKFIEYYQTKIKMLKDEIYKLKKRIEACKQMNFGG